MSMNVDHRETDAPDTMGETLKTIAIAVLIAVIIRIFLFQPFNIPSGSMIPNLLIGDYLFVSKYDYGLSRHSFPFSPPLFSGRLFASEPERGDVAVFKFPPDGRTDYIKRVIGLPGDTIALRNGVLIINDERVPRVRVEDFIRQDGKHIRQFRETLPNGVEYNTLDEIDNSFADNFGPVTVPEGHFFMMGDNRDRSNDSRLDVGFVPFENFVGKAEVIFFSTDGSAAIWEFWQWPFATRWSRFFNAVE